MAPPRKQLSGAEKRKRKLERERAAAAAQAKAHGVPLADEGDDGSDEFAALGPPPLDDPDKALAWVRRYQLTAMHVAASKPLTEHLRERLKFVREFGATIGMTQNRVELETLAERLETALLTSAPRGAVKTQPTNAIARSALARGGSGSRGPRPVPRPPTGSDEPDGRH